MSDAGGALLAVFAALVALGAMWFAALEYLLRKKDRDDQE